ncbi:MAG: hypothetical protein JNN00_17670 [Chitinophagaceae bacterium]|nr:hypothetical protein [Chitinophagaceae bacterium]
MNKAKHGLKVIGDYFSCWSLRQALTILKSAINATATGVLYKGRSPGELVYFIDKTKELLGVAFEMLKENSGREKAVLTKEEMVCCLRLSSYHLYCGWHRHEGPWHFFPRHLSRKEFTDPFHAFCKVTAYQNRKEWFAILKDLQQYALSATAYHSLDPELNLTRISQLLHKLIEAAHLIEVRVVSRKRIREIWS